MKIPQHVILDLLPLYLAEEVSEETRNLIEEYLRDDPQLVKLAEQAKFAHPLQEIPAPTNKESEMEAFKKAKKLMVQHNVFLILAVVTTFMFGMSLIFLLDENPIAPYVIFGLAGFFWFAFFVVNRQIGD
jgi:hypothetical protein